MKKILSLLLSLVLISCASLLKPISNVYSEDKNISNILDDIKNNNDIQDIKKIEFDNKKQEIKSIEDVNLNSKLLNLDDGTYLIDRGYGWVLGDDASFLNSGFANPGETVMIQNGKMVGTEHNIITGSGVGFDLKVVKLAVELLYEHTISDETNILAGFSLKAPSNKSLYVKTYATYRWFDMIKVKNRSLIEHSATYEPNGTWAKRVIYNSGETVDQNALKEKVARNILGEPEIIDIENTISVIGLDYIKNLDILINSSSSSLEVANRSNTKIHPGFFSNDYFGITLSDKFGKEKASMKMSGNDYSNDPKFDQFNKIAYSIGDIITIYHEEPFRLKISGSISGNQNKNNKIQRYRITENGLNSLNDNEILPSGTYHITNDKQQKQWYIANEKENNIILSTEQKPKGYTWVIIYNEYRNAYQIINDSTKQQLILNPYNELYLTEPNSYPYTDQFFWEFIKNENGTYTIKNKGKNIVFDSRKGSPLGTSTYEKNNINQQFFLFYGINDEN